MADTTTMHISLPKTMKAFVEDTLAREGYGTTSEYVKALIRADQKKKEAEKLEQVLVAALTNGEVQELTDDVWNDLKEKVEKRVAETKKMKLVYRPDFFEAIDEQATYLAIEGDRELAERFIDAVKETTVQIGTMPSQDLRGNSHIAS